MSEGSQQAFAPQHVAQGGRHRRARQEPTSWQQSAVPVLKRCPQCWQLKASETFISHTGRTVRMCDECRRKYRHWYRLTIAEKIAIHTPMPLAQMQGHRVGFSDSMNRKTGRIWVSMTDRSSCPPSCPLYCKGCYAEFHWSRAHWLDVPSEGMPWDSFCEAVSDLDPGQVWRHNEAGDLPGIGDALDSDALAMLVEANSGRRGFTYTHKPITPELKLALSHANRKGFAISLSVLGLRAADEAAALGVAPVVTVLPHDLDGVPRRTPGGLRIVPCPAGGGVTCASCGLCADPARDVVVAFHAHGQWKKLVSELAR